jgi:RNA polymerase sigma-70 factor (ECF subfamily)
MAPRERVGPADREWVRALQRREPCAWERLQREAVDPVFGYVYLRCGRREEAEDITAEVFAAAVAGIDRFRGDAAVITWLIAIARRKLRDTARRQRRHPELLEADLDPAAGGGSPLSAALVDPSSPESLVERRETQAAVRRLVLQLPEAQREALWLRCVDGLCLAEIARVMRRTEDSVKALLRRARGQLQQRLGASDAAGQDAYRRRCREESSDVERALSPQLPVVPPRAE